MRCRVFGHRTVPLFWHWLFVRPEGCRGKSGTVGNLYHLGIRDFACCLPYGRYFRRSSQPGRYHCSVVPFCVAQLAGAFGGAVLAYSLYSSLFTDFESAHNIVRGSAESLQLASIFSTYPAAAINVWQAALVEVVITSMLMGLIMALTDDGNGVPKGPLAPLLIGILVAVIGASTGPLTGFAMNPARDFGPKIFTWLAGWGEIAMTGGRNIPYFIVPIIAPIIGACVGAAIYRYLIAKNLPVNSVTPKEISE